MAGTMRNIESVDKDTGEVLQGSFVYVPEKKKSPFGRDWFAVAQSAMMFLAKNRKMLGEEGFAVFCALAGRLDFENYILVNQAEIGREMGMDRANVNKSIKRLETLGILTRGPKSGTSPTFKLNPQVGWKGQAKKHFSALQQAKIKGWKLVSSDKEQPELPL